MTLDAALSEIIMCKTVFIEDVAQNIINGEATVNPLRDNLKKGHV